jgi:hypothetical protein
VEKRTWLVGTALAGTVVASLIVAGLFGLGNGMHIPDEYVRIYRH